MSDFFYAFLSSRLAVGSTVSIFLLLLTGAIFRIIPWWLFFVTNAVLGGGVALYAIVREWLALRADKSFERGMSAQAESQMSKRKVRDRDAVRDMHERWKEGLERLRQTRIGKRKRAIYFLPWYLIIGKPATGKTTAIKNSGLHFPLGVPKTAGTGGTRNCDWFFTEEAILLDTAGRYTESDENEADKEEWLAFLRLVRKYRRDMPINGLLVAIAADDLLGRERDEIEADARGLRNKLEELMRELGIQFPVYLLITKCDLVQGFTDFFGRLPKSRLTELLGWTNPSWDLADLNARLQEAFDGLRDRCRALRPVFLRDETSAVAVQNVYIFPEELDALTKNLALYCDILFRETKFSDSPFLRGIYLTSGLQTGTAVSKMLGRLGVQSSATRVAEGSRSFFLQDFFQERLKADQRLVTPTGKATVRFRVANNLALAGAVGACVLVGLLATASYIRNRTLLLSIEDAVRATTVLAAKPASEQMALLDDYREAIETLRYRNQHRGWLERFGLYSGTAVEAPVIARFRTSYGRIGYDPALASADKALVDRQNPVQSFSALDSLIAYLMLTKNAQLSDLSTGGETLAPWWNGIALQDPDTRDQYAAAFRFHVREPWRDGSDPERETARQERQRQLELVRQHLPDLLSVTEIRRWLAGGKPVRGADFDLPGGAGARAIVQPAFTPTAWRERVVPLLAALEQIQGELEVDVTSTFAAAYASEYFRQWYQFILDLQEPPAGSGDSRRFCDQKSPFFVVFEAAYDATTRPFIAGEAQPIAAAAASGAAQASDAIPRAAVVPGFEPPAWVQALGKVVGEKPKYVEKMDPACQAGGDLADPCGAALQLAGASGALGSAPLAQLRDWVTNELVNVRAAAASDDRRLREHVAKLLNVPVTRALSGSTGTCAGFMKGQLRQSVERFPYQPPWTLEQLETLFVPSRGLVWQYCEQTLTPFFNCVSLRQKPNVPVQVPGDVASFLNRADRFSRTFFDSGGSWRTHSLNFESVPSTSSSDSRVTQTALTVSCTNTLEQPWELRHRQTLVRKSLSWRPDQCGEARLQVSLSRSGGIGDEQTVEIVKPGPFGLVDLLSAAQRSGNEFRWQFPGGLATAAFRIVVPDQGLLEAGNMRLYR